MMVPFSLFPRSGLMPEGAGAPLLLPELARSSGGEGGKGTNRRGLPTFCKLFLGLRPLIHLRPVSAVLRRVRSA
ncbi:hypothetical protein CN152_28845, partial [Sinorhizobium meliloti]